MNLYLVRHGESEEKAEGIRKHQTAHVPLSEKGKQQAIFIAERLKKNGPCLLGMMLFI